VKFFIPLLIGLATMGIAIAVVSLYFKIDLKAELGRLLPAEDLPESVTDIVDQAL
jgi:hypothetical protein